MLSIRLARNGAKKRPFFHIVVSENDRIPTGRALEILGFSNPQAGVGGESVRIDVEKAKVWLAKGASPSKSVLELFQKDPILKAFIAEGAKGRSGVVAAIQNTVL